MLYKYRQFAATGCYTILEWFKIITLKERKYDDGKKPVIIGGDLYSGEGMYPKPSLVGAITKNMCQARRNEKLNFYKASISNIKNKEEKRKKDCENSCLFVLCYLPCLKTKGLQCRNRNWFYLYLLLVTLHNRVVKEQILFFLWTAPIMPTPQPPKGCWLESLLWVLKILRCLRKLPWFLDLHFSLHYPLPDCPLLVSILPYLSFSSQRSTYS